MKIKAVHQKIDDVLTRRVEEILPDRESLKKIMQKRKIRVYLGIDPTGSKLHLGHTITLRKLQDFADLGHEAILVIGTGTVLAGDPSLREEARKMISEKEIEKNIKTWKEQAGKIVDFSKVEIKYNGDWLLKLSLGEIIKIASKISAAKLFQREMFRRRIKSGGVVWTHEFFYPLLQGYDSVHLKTDLEIGGTDQVFNMLIGRELEEKMLKKDKFVLTCPMVLGTDGKTMSKTSGNCVWISDPGQQMYGKIMSIRDSLIWDYFKLLTNLPLDEIAKIKKLNPREAKASLAREIVKMYHGANAASGAEKEFERIFKENKAPTKMPGIRILDKEMSLLQLLVRTKLVSSKSEARRLVSQKGIKIDSLPEDDWQKIIRIKNGTIVQVGKRKFVKIIQTP